MGLIINKQAAAFDLESVKPGYLIYGKHMSWNEGKSGFVTSVTEKQIIVQYHPGIGNVTNHYFIPVEEVMNGEWIVRWSSDMLEVNEYDGTSFDDEEDKAGETEAADETGRTDI